MFTILFCSAHCVHPQALVPERRGGNSLPIVKPNTETQSARPVRELLAHRPYWAWSVTAQLCRAPTLMAAMAFSGLTAATTGSSKAGGVLVSSLVLAEVAFAGVGGRLLDRSGGRAVPALAAAVSCSAMAAAAVAAVLGARLPVLCVLSAVAGTALAGLPGLVRHRLNAAVPQRLLEPALSVDATVVELVVVGAPLIVSVVLLAGPAGGVVAMAVAAGLAAVLLALGRTGGHETGSDTSRPDGHGRLWAPGFVAWIAVSFAFGHALGAIETAALSLAETLRSGPFGGGAIIAVLALSSAAAGLGYAAARSTAAGRSRTACRAAAGAGGGGDAGGRAGAFLADTGGHGDTRRSGYSSAEHDQVLRRGTAGAGEAACGGFQLALHRQRAGLRGERPRPDLATAVGGARGALGQ